VFGRKTHKEHDDTVHGSDTGPVYTETTHERYGGFTFAAAFYGWLVAVALTVLLAGIVGAGATAANTTLNVTQSEAERQAGTLGLASAIALLVILLIAYFAGGYVAGRMSRFDGGRQGLGVWLLGLLVTILVAVLGAVFGTQYDIFQRVNLPATPVPTNTLTVGGIIPLVAVVVGTLLAAMLGGKAGQRYHTKIDRAVAA
jgi:MFS family permease